jgi:hypothetical protein
LKAISGFVKKNPNRYDIAIYGKPKVVNINKRFAEFFVKVCTSIAQTTPTKSKLEIE